ncbi:hypothetical protein B0H13DRAFT_1870117 [Mycena leptocephala]|nr:hypothetical protein B0H13DRAFT_1870117 [Mycena leptocephala]
MEYSSGHYLAEDFSRKVYKSHFDAELKTLREWLNFTSNPTLIPGGGPMRMAPATFLTRTLQEDMFAEARYNVLKDVVAPVSSAEVMDQSDFALNHTSVCQLFSAHSLLFSGRIRKNAYCIGTKRIGK